MGVVDTLMVARLGTAALGATMLGHVWVFGTISIGMGVLFGLDPIVSQAHGARDGDRAGLALQSGLALSILFALPVVLSWWLTGPILVLAGQAPDLASVAHDYVQVQLFSAAPFLVFTALRQYLAGRAILRPAMWIMWITNLINVAVNWVLIFGHLGFEPMGVVGAGIASGISRTFPLLALGAWVVLGRLHEDGWPGWTRVALEPARLAEIVRYGWPVGLQMGLEIWAFHLATLLAGLIGRDALAAHTIALTLASMTFMVPLGVSVGVTTRVGNLTGARDPAGARRAGMIGLAMGAGVMGLSALGFLLFRYQLPLLWRPTPEVLALAAAILPVAAAFQVFDGTQVVGCGVLRGIGDTRPAAMFNLIGYWGLSLPLGIVLAFRWGMGVTGLWWGLTFGLATVAVLLVVRITRKL